MQELIDNKELNEIMDILENMEDEELSAQLLVKLNKSMSHLGKLVMNMDPNLNHDEWENLCDQARDDLEQVIAEIKNHGQ